MNKDKNLQIGPGPEEQNLQEQIKVQRKFPDYGSLYPPITQESILNEVDTRNELARLNSIPKHVTDLNIVTEQVFVSGRTMVRVTVWFLQSNDSNFDGAKVFIKGYGTGNVLGDPGQGFGRQDTIPYALVAEIEKSPFTFLLERTGEEVVIAVQAINSASIGADRKSMPSLTLTLDTNDPG